MSKYVTILSGSGEESLVRAMPAEQLEMCLTDLKRQYGEIQAAFITALNRQISLTAIISAIEYEQERRDAASKN